MLGAATLLVVCARPATAKSTTRANIRGIPHDFTVPDDWQARPSAEGIEFVPPRGRASAPMTIALVGVEKPAGADAESVVRALAENDRKRRPYLDYAKPEEIEFVGTRGVMIILAGRGPSGEVEATMLVVAVSADLVYLFNAEGRLADIRALVDDIAVILSGVKRLGTAPDRGTARSVLDAGPVWLDDPGFGLRIKGLRAWKLSIADDEYQLERTDEAPAAAVSIRRVPMRDRERYERDVSAGTRARRDVFARREALILERQAGDTVEREVHVLGENHVIVLEFRVVGRAGPKAVEARIEEVEQALELADKDAVTTWDDGRTDLASYGGLSVSTSAGWKLASVGPGTANFVNGRGVQVEVRVRPWPSVGDPYALVGDELKARCGKGAYTRVDAAVLGAQGAMRYRCASRDVAEAVLVADGVGPDGGRVWVKVTARPRKKGHVPDGEIAEFSAYVSLPRRK